MTAVEYVIEQLRKLAHNPKTHLGMGDIRVTQGYLDDLEQIGKQMERRRVETAFEKGIEEGYEDYISTESGQFSRERKTGSQYYNETYE